jgi:hypothetical protein
MDGSRFDAWTRRQFGLAAGGLAGSLLTLAGLVDAEAKKKGKKKKKKKCKKAGTGCNPNSKKRKCCKKQNLTCAPIPGLGGNRCCKGLAQPCAATAECCSGFCLDGFCEPEFCKEIGAGCGSNPDCCSDFCNGGTGKCDQPPPP